MSFLNTISEKSWQNTGSKVTADKKADHLAATRKSGMKVLCMVLTALFGLFIIAYLMRTQFGDWQPLAEEPWQPLFNKVQLWLNTGYLALASIAMYLSTRAMKLEKRSQAIQNLLLGGIFVLVFIWGQSMIWQQFIERGFVASANPANGFFFMLTGLHGVHLLIGLLAWSWTMFKFWQKHPPVEIQANIEMCTLYWHFLFAVWLVLFSLFVSSPETYQAIAAFCGF